jgi:hypothetical protein
MAKKLYRMVDQYGNTLYSDQVPPEQVPNRRETLSPSARVLEVTERAKSKEQQDFERRLAALRKEEEKLIAKQVIHDNALLSTFDSEDEIRVALKAKMQLFDDQRKVIENSLQNAQLQLQNWEKNAANIERNGQKVSPKMLENIQAAQAQVERIKKEIRANIDKKNMTEDEFHADIARYLFLTQSVKKTAKHADIPSIQEANALGLFHCENDHQCNKAWEIARVFVNQHSTTKPDVYNDKLIMNRPPATEADISLSLSRITITENDYQLFLDIHCHNSAIGEELCSSQKVRDLRHSFRAFVNDALSRATAQQ